jgi:hypothetical protein
MNDTGISEEIAALREQIAATEAEIARGKPSSGETERDALIEARDSMIVRLSRLESCKRTPEA